MGFKVKDIAHELKCGGYIPADKKRISEKIVNSWVSTNLEDLFWDNFLSMTPVGEFEQSSLWAQTKRVENWNPVRVLFTQENMIVGGFQILMRSTPLSRSFGYISKGPVIPSNDPDLIEFVIDGLRTTCKDHRISALMVQLPDRAANLSMFLKRKGFLPNHILNITHSTVLIDLEKNGTKFFDPCEKLQEKISKRPKNLELQ